MVSCLRIVYLVTIDPVSHGSLQLDDFAKLYCFMLRARHRVGNYNRSRYFRVSEGFAGHSKEA